MTEHHPYGGHITLLCAIAAAAVATALWLVLMLSPNPESLLVVVGGTAAVVTIASMVLFAFAYTHWVPKKYRQIDLHEARGEPWLKTHGQ